MALEAAERAERVRRLGAPATEALAARGVAPSLEALDTRKDLELVTGVEELGDTRRQELVTGNMALVTIIKEVAAIEAPATGAGIGLLIATHYLS